MLTRLHIGHTYITHHHLLEGTESPLCITCQERFTVKHLWLECVDFDLARRKYYQTNNLKQLFTKIEPSMIFDFLKKWDCTQKYKLLNNRSYIYACVCVYMCIHVYCMHTYLKTLPALNDPPRLICHKTKQPTNQPIKKKVSTYKKWLQSYIIHIYVNQIWH